MEGCIWYIQVRRVAGGLKLSLSALSKVRCKMDDFQGRPSTCFGWQESRCMVSLKYWCSILIISATFCTVICVLGGCVFGLLGSHNCVWPNKESGAIVGEVPYCESLGLDESNVDSFSPCTWIRRLITLWKHWGYQQWNGGTDEKEKCSVEGPATKSRIP